MNELLPSNFGVTFVDGFQEFLDDHGLLNRELSRDLNRFKRPDFLYLNWGGLAKLVALTSARFCARARRRFSPLRNASG